MYKIKKISAIIMLFILSTIITLHSHTEYFRSIACVNSNEPIKVSVLIGNYNIYITALIAENLAKIEQEIPGTVNYTFYDGKGDQDIQNEQLKSILTENNTNLIILDMADVKYTKYTVDRIKESNLPVIYLGNADTEPIMSYRNAYFAGPNPAEGGILQGGIVVDEWRNAKGRIDKNGDNKLQYIMLEGTPTNIYAIERTKYSLLEISNNNIKTVELAAKICNWSADEAEETISELLLRYGNTLELIIANDDAMAIGAIKALQKYGYNLENKKQNIRVIGFDGIPKAQELIKVGVMSGTVIANPYDIAKVLYITSLNIINHRNIIDGVNATVDITGKIVIIPYEGVIANFS